MWAQPGKKLLFMGGEFAQWSEWNHDASLDWNLLASERHSAIRQLVQDLNALYKSEHALYELDCDANGFEWVDANDWEASAITFLRKGKTADDVILVALNFTPVVRQNYRIGVPGGGFWKEILNSDAEEYGGSGVGNAGGVKADEIQAHGRPFSVNVTLPPLAGLMFKLTG
jgi:1,4-alpha-glucan branching enzyme